MAFLKIVSLISLLTLPFALSETGNAHGRIPLQCLILGLPHLIATIAPQARRSASIGIAIGSSAVLFVGLTFNALLSLIRLFPTEGSSWPWLAGALAHAMMFGAAIAASRAWKAPEGEVPVYGWVGCSYSIISIVLVQVVAKIHF